jgi:hypothetical protein
VVMSWRGLPHPKTVKLSEYSKLAAGGVWRIARCVETCTGTMRSDPATGPTGPERSRASSETDPKSEHVFNRGSRLGHVFQAAGCYQSNSCSLLCVGTGDSQPRRHGREARQPTTSVRPTYHERPRMSPAHQRRVCSNEHAGRERAKRTSVPSPVFSTWKDRPCFSL